LVQVNTGLPKIEISLRKVEIGLSGVDTVGRHGGVV
jgi:hypothetical protein